jgi:hypothetical protein
MEAMGEKFAQAGPARIKKRLAMASAKNPINMPVLFVMVVDGLSQ